MSFIFCEMTRLSVQFCKQKRLEAAVKRLGLTFVCALLALSTASGSKQVHAQLGHHEWGQSGAWKILIDTSDGGGCYMENVLEDQTLVQLGIAPNRSGGFFAAYNANWTNIDDGHIGRLLFDFGATLFGGEYRGARHNGLPGGYAFFNNPEFAKEFGKRNEVSVTDESGGTLEFNLSGTMKAINSVRNCDAEQGQ